MWDDQAMKATVQKVTSDTVQIVQPLIRAYCDFYGVAPSDTALLRLSEHLVNEPSEGIQLIARSEGGNGEALGFATVFWTWSTLSASRIGVMNDLFVAPAHRGVGVAELLIDSCCDACRDHGATHLTWQTALDNIRAQSVYDRVGGLREQWLDYSLEVSPR